MAPDNRRERQREGSGSQAGEGTPPAAWLPGPGPGSPPKRVSPDKRQQGRQPRSSKPARRDPSSRSGTRKKSSGKGPRTTVHFQRPLLGRGTVSLRDCAARGSGGELGRPTHLPRPAGAADLGGRHAL